MNFSIKKYNESQQYFAKKIKRISEIDFIFQIDDRQLTNFTNFTFSDFDGKIANLKIDLLYGKSYEIRGLFKILNRHFYQLLT